MDELTLRFSGGQASKGEIDLYDLSRSLQGLHRSLGLTAHFALTGNILTQAPSIDSVKLTAGVSQEGSWEIPIYVAIIATTAFKFGTAPRDSVIGHLTYSLYDMVVRSVIGAPVEFDKSLTTLHKEVLERKRSNNKPVDQSRLDSLIEKTESSVIDIHRPVVFGEAAKRVKLLKGSDLLIPILDNDTWLSTQEGKKSDNYEVYEGRISSYNMNTYKGRIFLFSERRSIPFKLEASIRNRMTSRKLGNSLARNIADPNDPNSILKITAFPTFSLTDRLKSLDVIFVSSD